MKRFLIALTLMCVLSGTALAGDMPGVSPSPAPGDVPTVGSPSPGDVPTTDNASPGDIASVGLSVVLTILDLAF